MTQQLGVNTAPKELRGGMLQPKATNFGILGSVLVLLLIVLAFLASAMFMLNKALGQEAINDSTMAIARLSEAIQRDYSYVDLRGIDWQDRVTQFRPKLMTAKNSQEFATICAEFLKEAKDPHIWLKVGDKTIGTHQHNAVLNFNPRVLPKLLSSWKQHGKTVITGTNKDGFPYVLISTWDHREPESMAKALEAIRESAKSNTPIIIDVRPNSGGDEMQARKVASYFVNKLTPYAAHSVRKDGENLPMQKRQLNPSEDSIYHEGPCIVLMGPVNMSSCESFLKMMRAAGAQLVGKASVGSSGNPKPHDLGNGVIVFLPSWRDMDLDGKITEGKGVEPDIRVDVAASQFLSADPVFDKACEMLKSVRP